MRLLPPTTFMERTSQSEIAVTHARIVKPTCFILIMLVLPALFIAGWFGACRLVGIRIVRYRPAVPAEARAANSP